MQGSLLSSATLALQEEESRAAFQGINNSAKGWVSSGRLGWPAGMLDALSGPLWANRLTDQENSTWVTGPKKARPCWIADRAAACIHSLGEKNPLSPRQSVETLLGCQEGEQVELSWMGPSALQLQYPKRQCLQP